MIRHNNKKGKTAMTYKEAAAYMEQIQKKGSVLGLGPIRALLQKLGNPQNQLKIIHVAGTNGKGSICTFLEAMYRAEGKRVGRYVSPTLNCYLERFQINGSYMEEQMFAGLLEKVCVVIEEMHRQGEDTPTAFEIETAIAFLYFVEEQVELVILETGMGGRLDATNVIERPLCTVFASISMDHMQFLGDTIEQIAYEKAGILKPGSMAVSYPNAEPVMEILEKQFLLKNAGQEEKALPPHFHRVMEKDIEILSETLEESVFLYRGAEYRIRMAGEYQIYNAATAIEAKLLLDGKLVKESLLDAHWEGRFEVLSKEPFLLRDGAHNVDGMKALKKSLQKHFTNRVFLFIIGVLKDKDYQQMMGLICPLASEVYTITPETDRALSGDILRECVLPYCVNVASCDSVDAALQKAVESWKRYETMGQEAVIVACGSLSYLGQIAV